MLEIDRRQLADVKRIRSHPAQVSRRRERREPLSLMELFVALRSAVNEGDASRVASLERRIDRVIAPQND